LEEDNEKADEIIDEAELNRLKQLKDLKRQYRDNFKELKDLKSQASFQQQSIDNSKSQLVRDFEQWYEDSF
jgi:kinesin family member 6/9